MPERLVGKKRKREKENNRINIITLNETKGKKNRRANCMQLSYFIYAANFTYIYLI